MRAVFEIGNIFPDIHSRFAVLYRPFDHNAHAARRAESVDRIYVRIRIFLLHSGFCNLHTVKSLRDSTR